MNLFKHSKGKVFLVLIVLAVAGIFYALPKQKVVSVPQYKTEAEKDVYVRFDMEAFDSIMKNYWKQATSSDLAQFFQLSLQKASGDSALPNLVTQDRAGVANMLNAKFQTATSTYMKKQLAVNILNIVLYNLAPQGRDQLMSAVQETQLRQEVANINPAKDLYQDLGLQKGADQKAVEEAYKVKQSELAKATSTEAKAELAKTVYAHKVLANPNSKKVYDQTQSEPTVFTHVIGSTLYLNIHQISPTTLNEFVLAVDSASTTANLSNMIIDLRGNVGGDLSFPMYFLGLFIGQNQYAFDLYHQGTYDVQRTIVPKFPELDRFKEIAVFTDSMTQSTAELLTATLKRLKLAHVVGTKTRGWGSVENTYPLETVIDPKEKYSLFLVNSLTLRDDNQPIEINGVLPDVDIGASDWKKKLPTFFNSTEFVKTISKLATEQPMK